MTPQEAADGLIELVLADGGRFLVALRDQAADDPAIEAGVVRAMLDAMDSRDAVCAAVDGYAEATGLVATYADGDDVLIVAIGNRETG
jgi:hypothetical protein